MSDTADPLKVLGIAPGANMDDARESYRRLCVKYHPDKHPGHDELFQEVTEAYAKVRADPSLLRSLSNDRGGVVSYLSGGFRLAMKDIYLAEERSVSFQRVTKCGRCAGTGSSDGAAGICQCCCGMGIIESSVLSIMGRDSLCPICKGSGIVGTICGACHGDKTVAEDVKATFRATLRCYYKKGVLLKGFGNVRPDGTYEDLMVKLDIHKDPYVSVEENYFKVYVNITPAQKVSGDRGILSIFGRKIPYRIEKGGFGDFVYDGIRPGFQRGVRIIFRELLPDMTEDTIGLYRRIREAESKSCEGIGSMVLTSICVPKVVKK